MANEQHEQFGRYELQSRIGRGGMAETWRAQLLGAAGVTKPVLIKKVLPEFANDEAFVSMFISEARISATLSHGAIAQVFDFGQVDGEYFLAMEYVDGQPLNRIMKRALRSNFASLPVPIATYIALEMCRGLHYAHTRADDKGEPLNIVHRDISPDNVLISYEGQVKIVDFGIAKARSLRSFDTAPGVVKGKYLFFSPEQARGEDVDARTDVWATAVVLFEMVCGRLPLEGPEYVVMHKLHTRQPLPRPRDIKPDLPVRLEAILQKALAVKKEDRFESAHAFGDALAGFLFKAAPRFSAMSAAYLLRELFRPDLTEMGKDTKVPPSFVEELSVWRATNSLLPKPTEISAPELRTEPQTIESHPGELPDGGEGLDGEDEDEDGNSPDRGGFFENGFRISTHHVVVAAGLLVLAGFMWSAFDKLKSDWVPPKPSSSGPARPPLPTPPLKDADARRPTDAPPRQQPAQVAAGKPPEAMDTVHMPMESFRLDARRHLFGVSSGRAALGTLNPEVTYRISESGVLSPADRGKPMPSIFFLLSGKNVAADAAVGLVTRKPEPFRGASAVMIFTVGAPTPQDDLPERIVTVTNTRTNEERRHTIHLEWMTTDLSRSLFVDGLDPMEVYTLLLEPVEGGAFTRGRDQGPVVTVACVQQVSVERDGPSTPPARAQRFLLSRGEDVKLSGVHGLYCGFIDDDPTDNQGAVSVRIETARATAERAAAAAERAEAETVEVEVESANIGHEDAGARPGGHVSTGTRTTTSKPATSGKQQEIVVEPEESPEASRGELALEQAKALFKSKQFESARTRARECVAMEPENFECHLFLGSVAARLGRKEEGAKHYRLFLDLAPSSHAQASKVLRVLEEYESMQGSPSEP
ncbi:protein kinase [Myxococcus sp. CA056]|uniref:protein kinase domain-containing protein n=1 Tax=unclassified Myxococcus TaxID=2648731 RepID=UPI00157A7750|nr:protein kinase [Myxococcus sp. CA039A]NTX13919.1 protein kinase [Myxococcus sp. CA056]NTX36824.1 protein kinase [Myxococcus sp. CA033]NTX56347.1 protein kinase [Myxococcus sp. CA039A]